MLGVLAGDVRVMPINPLQDDFTGLLSVLILGE